MQQNIYHNVTLKYGFAIVCSSGPLPAAQQPCAVLPGPCLGACRPAWKASINATERTTGIQLQLQVHRFLSHQPVRTSCQSYQRVLLLVCSEKRSALSDQSELPGRAQLPDRSDRNASPSFTASSGRALAPTYKLCLTPSSHKACLSKLFLCEQKDRQVVCACCKTAQPESRQQKKTAAARYMP